MEIKCEGPVPIPYFTYVEKSFINVALRMHKEYRPNDRAEVDNVAVIVSRDGVLYEYQFRLLFRAVLIYKLNVPEKATDLHRIVGGVISKMREVISKYGLDNDKRNEEEVG
jgi:hypothetical protein